MKRRTDKFAWRMGVLLLGVAAAVQAQDPDPAVTPAFTEKQQADGGVAYMANCAIGCHQPDLAGLGPIAPLTGERFLGSWGKRPLSELIQQIRTAMPPTNAGGLPQETYLNIVAYILSMNGGKAGANALAIDNASLVSAVTDNSRPPSPFPTRAANAPEVTGVTVPGTVPDFVPVSEAEIRNPDPADWIVHRGNLQAHSYSALDQINTDNVKGLQLVWSWTLNDDATNQLSPLVHKGVMYIYNPGNVIQALTADTGELIWEHRLGGKGGTMRGMAIYEDKLIMNTPGSIITALDAANGTLLWTSKIGESDGFSTTSGPLVADGKIFTGMTGCTTFRAEKCFVSAYSAEDGHLLWKFDTVAQSGTPGGDTWNNVKDMFRSGNDTWITPSYDPDSNTVFIGVSQPKPWMPISRGMSVADAALYSNSTLALDGDTGELKWYYQHVPGEAMDLDEVFERVLIDDGNRKLVYSAGKHGILWKLDRETGQYLGHKETIFQNMFSSFDPKTGRPTYRNDIAEHKFGEWVSGCPSSAGGHNWQAMSYHKGTHSLVLPLSQSCVDMKAAQIEFKEGGGGGAVSRRWFPIEGKEDKIGKLAAYDIDTMQELWSFEQPASYLTSVLTTAGNVLFVGDMDRKFRAHDVRDGKILWETRLGTSVQGFPITYMVNGEQYVAVSAGLGGGSPRVVPSILTPQIHYPDHGNALYVFKLPK